jgi:uncharacterized protein (DUF4415 family)
MPPLKKGTILPSDAEEAAIARGIAADPDTFELSASDFAQLQPVRRGRPKQQSRKVATTIRLDADVITYFRSAGEGWQSRINAALRKAAGL